MHEEINPWKILHQKLIYDNKWINVTEYDVINPTGGAGIYGKVRFKNIATGVFALDEDMHTYLVGQYRFTIDQYSWEIPEGGCPIDENPMDAAKRELLEETGLVAAKFDPLLKMYLSNSVTDEYCEVFLARGLSQQNANPDETEKLVVKRIPFQKAYQMVLENNILDAVSVAAILRVKILLSEGVLQL